MAFNLNKNDDSNSELDSSKKSNGTSKFDLSKNENVSPLSEANNKKSKNWFFALIGLILIVSGAWYFLSNSKNNSDIVNETSKSPTIESTVGAEPSNETSGLSGATTDTTATTITTGSSALETTTNAEPANSTNANINNNSSVSKTTSKNNNSSNPVNQGTTEEKAKQVISGVFGNGADRKKALGNEYAAIQAKVNEIYRNR